MEPKSHTFAIVSLRPLVIEFRMVDLLISDRDEKTAKYQNANFDPISSYREVGPVSL
jgi:hypothetical protein